MGLVSELNSQIQSKGVYAFTHAVPDGKGLLAKSQPKAMHHIRSPEAKDGAEIKSSSVAPYGQSLASEEGAPQVSGGPFSSALTHCPLMTRAGF